MRDLHRKRFLILLLYIAAFAPFVAVGAIEALKTNANSPIDWVSNEFPAKAAYESFRKKFGTGDIVVGSWPGCTVEEERLDGLLTHLRQSREFYSSANEPYLDRVLSGREQFVKLTSEPISLSEAEAAQRLQGSLLGDDGRQTCIVINLTAVGLAQRAHVVPLIRQAIVKFCGVAEEEIHLAGPVIDGLAVDLASQHAMQTFAPISSVLILLLCWVSLDSILAAFLVFGVSLLCQAMTLSLIHYSGDTMTALLIVLPPLIQVLAVAGGIHLVNYYFEVIRRENSEDAVSQAFRMGWLPCTLSATTTAIGLGSLMISQLVPVRAFGGYAAAGVMITLSVLLTLIPGMLLFLSIRPPASSSLKVAVLSWPKWIDSISRYRTPISLTAIIGMVLMAYGATRVKASVRIETLFSPESKVLIDYRWIEEHVGPLVPVEIILLYDSQCTLNVAERLRYVASIEETLQDVPGIRSVLSTADFLPEDSFAKQGSTFRKILALRRLHDAVPMLAETNYLHIDDQIESWRVTGFVSALDDVDYGVFLSDLRGRVKSRLPDDSEYQVGVTISFTGFMPLIHEIQRQLLHDLFASFLTAFGMITIVMTLVQAGILAGIVAMIPNIFPTLILFGGFGWLQIPMDIGSVMTASIALGIAVDDTLHFLTFFRRDLAKGHSRKHAVLEACQHCGPAMIQTTIVCGMGLLAFAFAEFVPTARFAWMMLALLVIALIGDLLLLPAILLGPLGKFFLEFRGHANESQHEPTRLSSPPELSQQLTE